MRQPKQKKEVSANSVRLEKTKRASGSTGPRSESGKRQSSRNAIKYGIFSQVTLLPHEPREEFAVLRADLRSSCNPQGGLEELLVDNLVSIAWRRRRLLVAEGAEIRLGVELFERDHRNELVLQAEEGRTRTAVEASGTIWASANPIVLKECLDQLDGVRDAIEEVGLDSESVAEDLLRIYGENVHVQATLRDYYVNCAALAKLSGKEGNNKALPTPDQFKETFLAQLSEEVQRLKRYGQECASLESDRQKIEVIRRNVPGASQLDRLIKYEASLDRMFDRTLSQLEHHQRLRKGQPISPTLNVKIDS
jgi:hypothetical protein